MVFPANWPPALPSGRRSLRFYQTGTASGAFADNAWLFQGSMPIIPTPVVEPGSVAPVHVGRPANAGASPPEGLIPSAPLGTGVASPNVDGSAGPPAMSWCQTMRITSLTGDLEFSFDGETVHGKIVNIGGAATSAIYRNRFEAGIAIRGAGVFIVEAW